MGAKLAATFKQKSDKTQGGQDDIPARGCRCVVPGKRPFQVGPLGPQGPGPQAFITPTDGAVIPFGFTMTAPCPAILEARFPGDVLVNMLEELVNEYKAGGDD